jgi:DNA-binding CsgD family transcriptional regulator
MGGNYRFAASGGYADAPGTGRLGFAGGFEAGGHALDWLARDRIPFLLLGDGFTILWENAAARMELGKQRGLEVREGALAATERRHQARLAYFLASADDRLNSWSLPRADGDGHILLRARKLDDAPWRCGVAFHASGEDFKADYVDLAAVFGLTPAEQRVLLGLLDGLDAQRLSERDEVSIETTRSHIRALYLKLDVSTREGLFHRTGPYRL